MKREKIIFYGRTQAGLVVLLYLVAQKKNVMVIPEDDIIKKAAAIFKLKTTTLENLNNETFDLFVCCHGRKIIPETSLKKGKFINIHPCLSRYKGHNPIARYMENKDTSASVESHYMVKEVDQGEVIASVFFSTPVIKSYAEFYNLAIPRYLECIDKALCKIETKNE